MGAGSGRVATEPLCMSGSVAAAAPLLRVLWLEEGSELDFTRKPRSVSPSASECLEFVWPWRNTGIELLARVRHGTAAYLSRTHSYLLSLNRDSIMPPGSERTISA